MCGLYCEHSYIQGRQTFSALSYKTDTICRQTFVWCLYFNYLLQFPFFIVSSTCFLFPELPVPPLPLHTDSSSICDELWITHYTFITARLCMSTFIYIFLITSAMFIHESPCWATPTSLSDGHGDPKCPWCVAVICLSRQLINRPAHQSFATGQAGLVWWAQDTCSLIESTHTCTRMDCKIK